MAPMTYAAADAPLSEVATEAKPLDLEVNIDGKPWKSDLISVDVLNIPFTGPALPLAHNADPGDTLLDVVGFESDKRDKLLNGLTAHRKACPAPLRSGEPIEIRWQDADSQLDDEVVKGKAEWRQAIIRCSPRALAHSGSR